MSDMIFNYFALRISAFQKQVKLYFLVSISTAVLTNQHERHLPEWKFERLAKQSNS